MNPYPHLVLEVLAYAIGARVYWAMRDPSMASMRASDRISLIAGAACGAALGSKLLYVLQYASALAAQPVGAWLAGKTVVGGLLGGWCGVEVAKHAIGWRLSTGDRFVVPFALAVAIGRVGCQLSGPWDLTYGSPTSLPWAWDYGDGLGRHPVAGYEAVALALFALWAWRRPSTAVQGVRFRTFVAAYLLLRFGLDFLKPPHGEPVAGHFVADLHAGLTAIQWVCVAGTAWCLLSLRRLTGLRPSAA